MSITFAKTEDKIQAFKNMEGLFQQAKEEFTPYAQAAALEQLEQLKNNFRRKTEDFFRQDRKLNVAVVGRVKAGKSSFLNMLLFKGKDILPRAFTPKTATLTKIEYAPQNGLEVEYYTPEEWETLQSLALRKEASEEGKAAEELVSGLDARKINASEYTRKGKERIDFPSEEHMMNELNRYVGENGELTPLVKSVVLYLNREELEGLSIVDTPGLNDPVLSRTQRTREFLELCDVVFFLSPASHFLNQGDIHLLKSQLPQKGIRRLSLICSRFDEGLVDTSYDYDSLPENIADTKKRLKNHAVNIFKSPEGMGDDANIKQIQEACQHPLFLSSVFHNMAGRPLEDYNKIEKKAYEDLNEATDDLSPELVKEIGDTDAIEQALQAIIEEKDALLAEKAKGFVPSACKEFAQYLRDQQQTTMEHIQVLETKDKEQLAIQRRKIQEQIQDIQAQLEEHFGNLNVKLEETKIARLKELRLARREASALEARTGTETQTESCRVSDSTWYKPWTWGKTRVEHYTYTVSYTYLMASDALDSLRNYSSEAASLIEEGLAAAVNVKAFKSRLLKIVVYHFDTGDTDYNPAYFRRLTEKTLNKIQFPVIHLTIDGFLQQISSRFSGEIRDHKEQEQLKELLSSCAGDLFDYLSRQLEQETISFEKNIDALKEAFGRELLKNINDDFDRIVAECDAKEKSIKNLKTFSGLLEEWSKKIAL